MIKWLREMWRRDHGGLLVTVTKATAWMLFLVRSASFNRMWLPVFTYSPVAFCWIWRRCHG
jgi:hypothetical protein